MKTNITKTLLMSVLVLQGLIGSGATNGWEMATRDDGVSFAANCTYSEQNSGFYKPLIIKFIPTKGYYIVMERDKGNLGLYVNQTDTRAAARKYYKMIKEAATKAKKWMATAKANKVTQLTKKIDLEDSIPVYIANYISNEDSTRPSSFLFMIEENDGRIVYTLRLGNEDTKGIPVDVTTIDTFLEAADPEPAFKLIDQQKATSSLFN